MYTGTYAEARAKLHMSEDTSNLETADSEEERQRSRDRRHKKGLDDLDDQASVADSSVVFKNTLPDVPPGLAIKSKPSSRVVVRTSSNSVPSSISGYKFILHFI